MKHFTILSLLLLFVVGCGEPPLDSAHLDPDDIGLSVLVSNHDLNQRPVNFYRISIRFEAWDGYARRSVRLSSPSAVFFNDRAFTPEENTWEGEITYFINVPKSEMQKVNRLTYIDGKGTKHERDLSLRGIEIENVPQKSKREIVNIHWDGPPIQHSELFQVEVLSRTRIRDSQNRNSIWNDQLILDRQAGRTEVPYDLSKIPPEVPQIEIYAWRSYTDPGGIHFSRAGGDIYVLNYSDLVPITLE